MNLLDYVFLSVAGFSVLLSVIRGLVREVIALAAWAIAFVVAYLFGGQLSDLMPAEIPTAELRWFAAFILLFFLVLLVMSLVAIAVSQLVKSAGLGVEDRVLGGLFGLSRGFLVVLALVLVAGATALPKQPIWKQAMLTPFLETAAIYVKGWLPPEVAKHISYR
jgi:membrane protein required for colicin V production